MPEFRFEFHTNGCLITQKPKLSQFGRAFLNSMNSPEAGGSMSAQSGKTSCFPEATGLGGLGKEAKLKKSEEVRIDNALELNPARPTRRLSPQIQIITNTKKLENAGI